MGPEIRASYTKLALRTLRLRQPTQWEALRAHLGDGLLQTVREAGPIAWLPADVHAAIADGMHATMGAEAARRAWRDVMVDAFDRALLKSLVRGALAIYGRKPSSIMRMTPQGWSLAWRECGTARMEERGQHEAWMLFEGLPRVITASHIPDSFVANCDAAMHYAGCSGTATPRRNELGAGKFVIEVRWAPSE